MLKGNLKKEGERSTWLMPSRLTPSLEDLEVPLLQEIGVKTSKVMFRRLE